MKLSIERNQLVITAEDVKDEIFIDKVLELHEHNEAVLLRKNVYSKTDTQTTLIARAHPKKLDFRSRLMVTYDVKEKLNIHINGKVTSNNDRVLNRILKDLFTTLIVNNNIYIIDEDDHVTFSIDFFKDEI